MAEGVRSTQEQAFRFVHHFGEGIPDLAGDEPKPIGGGTGPSPVQMLCASVSHCLSASLHFALAKFKTSASPLRTLVEPIVGRNEGNRLRVQSLKVRIDLAAAAADLPHLDRALAQFEDFCTVTASIRQGIPVELEVYDSTGARCK